MHQALIDAVRAGLNSKGMDGGSMYPFQITDTAPDDEINNTCRKEGAVCIGTHVCELSLGRAGMSQADAIAIALYQGSDFEPHQSKSGLWGVRRVKISGKPDYGTTVVTHTGQADREKRFNPLSFRQNLAGLRLDGRQLDW